MNLLDENIPEHQRQLLRSWRIPIRQIGVDVGPKGISDAAIILDEDRLPSTVLLASAVVPGPIHVFAEVVRCLGKAGDGSTALERQIFRPHRSRSHRHQVRVGRDRQREQGLVPGEHGSAESLDASARFGVGHQ